MTFLNLKKNLGLLVFASIIGASLLSSLFIFGGALKENAALNASKRDKLKLITSFFRGNKFPPSEVLLDYAESRKEKILEYHKDFSEVFVTDLSRMPVSVEGSLKFKEKLFNSQTKMIEEASDNGLEIEETATHLGFDKYETEIPLEEDITALTKELEAIEELTSLMMQSRMSSLERVKILESEDKNLADEKKVFVRIFPIQITMEGGFSNFVKFLELCGKSKSIFVASDMHIYQSDLENRTIKADILFNRVVFLQK